MGLGLLVVGAALGFGELIAGLTRATSPVVTVGDTLGDNSPPFLMEWAISLFGMADKAVLITGVLVVLVLAGALLGVVSLRRPAVGYAGLLLFTVAGLAAVVLRRADDPGRPRPWSSAGRQAPWRCGSFSGVLARPSKPGEGKGSLGHRRKRMVAHHPRRGRTEDRGGAVSYSPRPGSSPPPDPPVLWGGSFPP